MLRNTVTRLEQVCQYGLRPNPAKLLRGLGHYWPHCRDCVGIPLGTVGRLWGQNRPCGRQNRVSV